MKKYMKAIYKYTLILIASVLVGFFLLCIVFLLPTQHMKQNLSQDMDGFVKEGVYPFLEYSPDSILDNYTDGLMLGQAVYDSDELSLINRVVNAYYPTADGMNMLEGLKTYCDGNQVSRGEYARYWQGYLVFLKPILCFTSYFMWRSINRVIQLLLVLLAIIMLIRNISWKCVIPFLGTVVFLRPQVVYYSLQYSTMFYVSVISVILFAGLFHKIQERKWMGYFFFILGIVTNFLDYLTYPALGLGLCLVIWLMCRTEKGFIQGLLAEAAYCISWLCGYAGMWAGKWTVASIVLKKNIFREAFSAILMRSSSTNSENAAISRLDAVSINWDAGTYGYTHILLVIVVIVLFLGIWQWHKYLKDWAVYIALMIPAAMIPFVWFFVLGNHSFVHYPYTYRLIGITVAALLAIGWRVVSKPKEGELLS